MSEKLKKWINDDALYDKYLSFPQRVPFNATRFIKENLINIKLITSNISQKGISGFIKEENDGTIYICVHQFDNSNRKRFTICHELGHYFLHRESIKEGFLDGIGNAAIGRSYLDKDYNKKEMEANNFAAEILMPEPEFRGAYVSYGGNIAEIASFFLVSEAAAFLRAKSFGLLDKYNDSLTYFF